MVSGLDNVQKCLACRGPKRARTAPQPIRKKCFHSRDSQPLFTSVPKGVFRPIMLFLVAAERYVGTNKETVVQWFSTFFVFVLSVTGNHLIGFVLTTKPSKKE